MAIDKAYGSPKELKKLINECHKRGIAVILDVVYNHATGQNPYFNYGILNQIRMMVNLLKKMLSFRYLQYLNLTLIILMI